MALLRFYFKNVDPDSTNLDDVRTRDRNSAHPAWKHQGKLDYGKLLTMFATEVVEDDGVGYASVEWKTDASGHDEYSGRKDDIKAEDVVPIKAGAVQGKASRKRG